MLSRPRPCAPAALLLLACLLHGEAVRALPPRGGRAPPSLPSAQMAKALEYIEGLQQDGEEPGDEGDARAWRDEGGSQQLLDALLTPLQGPGQDPRPATAARNGEETRKSPEARLYGRYPAPEHSEPHQQRPLRFGDQRESPYKRTNEDAEPPYTPQSLATLQSVFQDLGKLSTSKDYRRQSRGQLYQWGDDDLYPLSDLAYEDEVGGAGWTPLEEKVETEEEIKDSREEFDRGLEDSDEADDDENENDDDYEDDGDEEDDVKRSSQPPRYRGKDDPEDLTKLVEDYLLKVLETEEWRQKRDAEDAGRRSALRPAHLDPQAVYQLIKISQKLRVPPEDLMEALKSRAIKKQKKVQEPEEEDVEGVEEMLMKISTYNKDRGPVAKYSSRLPERLKILKLLGMEAGGRQSARPPQQQRKPQHTLTWFYAPSGRRGNRIFSDGISDKREGDYDDTADEDKLATYLAARVLWEYPRALHTAEQKPAGQEEPRGAFQQTALDYFHQSANEKGSPSKRHPEPAGRADSPQTQSLDDETLLKVLEYLDPEPGERGERDQ